MDPPTSNATDLFAAAFRLFKTHHTGGKPVRSLSLRALGLIQEDEQLSIFPEEHDLELVIDRLRGKYGYARPPPDPGAAGPGSGPGRQGEHVIHPIGFLGTLDPS